MHRDILTPTKERGQSMVELALAITVLMILLAGTVDLGHAFFVWLAMRDAAQEGASYGSIRPWDTTGITARVKANYSGVITDPAAVVNVSVTTSGSQCLTTTPGTIKVEVNYTNFPLTMPFIGVIAGDSIPIHAEISDSIIVPCP